MTSAIHAGCVAYNIAFSNTINQARALCPGLKIYAPDFFTLLNKVLTNAASFGLTNALSSKGFSIDAYSDPALPTLTLNGPGTNYIFWDPHDPTAKFHEVIADVVQQLISPVQISQITALAGSNRLDVVNMPVGLNGFVDASTNGGNPVTLLAQPNWTAVQNITSTNTTQSIYVAQIAVTNSGAAFSNDLNPVKPADSGGPVLLGGAPPNYILLEFYRLRFPYAWSWP
jgi:phospholipase/lecithinase/hemolysin